MGWDSDTNTWEPVEHLAEDCKEKLEDFERRWKKRQERKTRMVTQLLMRKTWTMICDYQIIFILTISKYRPEIDNQN